MVPRLLVFAVHVARLLVFVVHVDDERNKEEAPLPRPSPSPSRLLQAVALIVPRAADEAWKKHGRWAGDFFAARAAQRSCPPREAMMMVREDFTDGHNAVVVLCICVILFVVAFCGHRARGAGTVTS